MQGASKQSGFRARMMAALLPGAMLLASPALAQDSNADAARNFGVRATVLDISLSPSGTKLAYIAAGPEHSEIITIGSFLDEHLGRGG